MSGAEVLVPMGFFGMVVCVVVGLPLVRAYARRLELGAKQPSLPMAEMMARLERIEQGVEAMSTEVERIAEGQRFTTRLLADRPHAALPAAPSTLSTPSTPPMPSATETGPEHGGNDADGTVLVPAARRP